MTNLRIFLVDRQEVVHDTGIESEEIIEMPPGTFIYFDNKDSKIVCYFVATINEPNQFFAEFIDTASVDLFNSFVSELREVVEYQLGWDIQESSKHSDERSFLNILSQTTSRSIGVDIRILERLAKGDRKLRIGAPDYKEAVRVLKYFQENLDVGKIVISDGEKAASNALDHFGDLLDVIIIKDSSFEGVTVVNEDIIQEEINDYQNNQLDDSFEFIQDQIEAISGNDAKTIDERIDLLNQAEKILREPGSNQASRKNDYLNEIEEVLIESYDDKYLPEDSIRNEIKSCLELISSLKEKIKKQKIEEHSKIINRNIEAISNNQNDPVAEYHLLGKASQIISGKDVSVDNEQLQEIKDKILFLQQESANNKIEELQSTIKLYRNDVEAKAVKNAAENAAKQVNNEFKGLSTIDVDNSELKKRYSEILADKVNFPIKKEPKSRDLLLQVAVIAVAGFLIGMVVQSVVGVGFQDSLGARSGSPENLQNLLINVDAGANSIRVNGTSHQNGSITIHRVGQGPVRKKTFVPADNGRFSKIFYYLEDGKYRIEAVSNLTRRNETVTITSPILLEVETSNTKGRVTIQGRTNVSRINITLVGAKITNTLSVPVTNQQFTWQSQQLKPGEYEIKIRASKNPVSTKTESSKVLIRNQKPKVGFSYEPSNVVVNEEIRFNASSSYDPLGKIQKYEWDFDTDGKFEKRGVTVTHSFGIVGNSTVRLRVTDSSGATVQESKVITIQNNNTQPIAAFNYSPSAPTTNQSITFSANQSHDPDGTIQNFKWDLNNDGDFEKSGKEIRHKFDSAGENKVTLRVIDNRSATNTTTQTITISSKS